MTLTIGSIPVPATARSPELSGYPPVIKNRTLRLSRNYLNLFDTSLVNFPLEEDIAFDGIESYLRSQYIPDNFNIAVGCTSQGAVRSRSPLSAAGRMTDVQRKPDRPRHHLASEPRSSHLVGRYLRYPVALHEPPELSPLSSILTKDRVQDSAQGSSRMAASERTSSRRHGRSVPPSSDASESLFPVNYLDREIRRTRRRIAGDGPGDREAG